jgi:hypothetical protein
VGFDARGGATFVWESRLAFDLDSPPRGKRIGLWNQAVVAGVDHEIPWPDQQCMQHACDHGKTTTVACVAYL